MPHTNAAQAITLLHSTMPLIFTWPSLPQRSFREYFQSAAGLPGLTFDTLARRAYVRREQAEARLDELGLAYLQRNTAVSTLTAEDAAGLLELLRNPAYVQDSYAIMSYLPGPISLGLQITDEQRRPLVYDPLLLEALTQHLALRVSWLTTRLANLAGSDVIICLDEPALMALHSPFCPIDWDYGIEVWEQIFTSTRGLCGLNLGNLGGSQHEEAISRTWAHVLETSVELVFIDVAHQHAPLLLAAKELAAFLKRPGTLVWGLVPADGEALSRETSASLLACFEQLLDHLVASGLSRAEVLSASLISTSSGLELLPIAAAEQALALCVDISAQIRARYNLTSDDE